VDSEPGISLTVSEVSDLLGVLQERFGWAEPCDQFESVETWERPRSGSAFYRMKGSPAGPDLVVKIVPSWRPGIPELAFRAMIELDDLITSKGIQGTHGIRPLAWSDHPPVLVMPYVESLDVVSILRNPDHQAWKSGDLERWMTHAGSVLAAYHQTTPPGWQPDLEEAETEVRRLARKLGVDSLTTDQVLAMADWRGRARRRYGDFGPGNFQGAPDGALYLLDPPIEHHTSVIHRDISNFLFEMRRQLAGRGFTPSKPVRGWFPDLRDRFLHGYVTANDGPVFGSADEALIALFEVKRAGALARKRLPRRAGDAAWFARLAVRRRRDLARAARHQGRLSSR